MADHTGAGDLDVAELADLRARVDVALDVLRKVEPELRFGAGAGSRARRPPPYVEIADRLWEGMRILAETGDRLTTLLDEKSRPED